MNQRKSNLIKSIKRIKDPLGVLAAEIVFTQNCRFFQLYFLTQSTMDSAEQATESTPINVVFFSKLKHEIVSPTWIVYMPGT